MRLLEPTAQIWMKIDPYYQRQKCRPMILVSRNIRSMIFGTNRKRIYDFLLVINSNFGPILHRWWDTATYWLKIAYFSYPPLIRRPRSLGSLWNFALKLTMRKRVMGLSYSEDPMIVAGFVLTHCQHVIDGQTDRRTDLRWLVQRKNSSMSMKMSNMLWTSSNISRTWSTWALRENT